MNTSITLLEDKISNLHWEAFADNKIYVAQIMGYVSRMLENFVRREKVEQISLFFFPIPIRSSTASLSFNPLSHNPDF